MKGIFGGGGTCSQEKALGAVPEGSSVQLSPSMGTLAELNGARFIWRENAGQGSCFSWGFLQDHEEGLGLSCSFYRNSFAFFRFLYSRDPPNSY